MTQTSTCKKTKTNPDTDLTSFTKINSTWIIDLNKKCRTTELPEYNIGENLNNLGFGNYFKIQQQRKNP